MKITTVAALVLLVLVACSGDSSNSSDQSSNPKPPSWLVLRVGNRVMLTGVNPEPSVASTTVVCDDEYAWDHYSTGNNMQGCRDRAIGQTVLIKRIDSGDSALYIRGHDWSGVVSNDDVGPIIPGGVTMDCQSTDSLGLYKSPSPNAEVYDLRDQKLTLETTHNRNSGETWAVGVRVVKGRGAARVGYLRSEDLASCTLPGPIQVVMQDEE